MTLNMIRNIILIIGWPVLIAGSIYLFVQGRKVYSIVKGSLVGNITKTLVVTMMVEMYSLGIVTTAYMMQNIKNVYLGLGIFIIWFILFIWTIKNLKAAQKEVSKITDN